MLAKKFREYLKLIFIFPVSFKKHLEKKLDYVIKLLEQQKNEKTDHVTEELVLYTFLGIFIIYIADSFVKVGKYVR